MKKWPPALADDDAYVTAFWNMLTTAKGLLEGQNLAPAERRIVAAMNEDTVNVRLAVFEDGETADTVVIAVEIMRRLRAKVHGILWPAPDDNEATLVPRDIAHTAFNALSPEAAEALADTLVADFVQQHKDAKRLRLAKAELDRISPVRREAELRAIHAQIRGRILPVVLR
jgi:hypothetical protein